jgi:hypothetical protein
LKGGSIVEQQDVFVKLFNLLLLLFFNLTVRLDEHFVTAKLGVAAFPAALRA